MTTWRQVFALGPSAMPLVMRARLGLPTIALLVVPALFGHFLLGLLMGLGSYSVLFGAVPRRRHRAVVMAVTGVGLVAAVCAGVAVSGSLAASLAAYVIAAFLGVVLDEVVPLGPPGPYFFVLMLGGGTLLTGTGLGIPMTAAYLALGSALAIAAGSLDALLLERGRSRPASAPVPAGPTGPPTWVVLVRVLVAVTASVMVSVARGDTHPFWGVLVVVLVLSYPGDEGRLTVRAVSRIVGALVGIALFTPLARVHLGTAGYVALLCVLLWCVARVTAHNYLVGSVVITLLALAMSVPLSPNEGPGELATARGVDTIVAGAIAVAVIWVIRTTRERRP